MTSRKGEVGKSTLSCHLSVCAGLDAVLIDTDSQADEGSCSTWMQARTAPAPRFYSYDDYKKNGIERLAEIWVPVFEFSDLADYARALASGKVVHEFSPKGKAAEQVRALWSQIEKVIA